MSATLFTAGKFKATDSAGVPLAGGLLYAYQAGTTTPQDTFTDQSGLTANSNPVVLDANGEADVWLTGIYKMILNDVNGVQQWSEDNISDVIFSSAFSGTSTTSSVITTGAIPFVTQAGKAWSAGQVLILASAANSSNYMLGQITSYSGTLLTMNITSNGGSGTHTDWNISLSGPQGPTGSTGGGGAGSGDVLGPATSADGYIAIFNGTNNKTIKAAAGAPGSAAYLNAGTGAGQVLLLDGSGHIPAGVWTGYTSGQQTITLAGQLTLTHSLGSQPKLYVPFLQCITAEGGYSIADEIPLYVGYETPGTGGGVDSEAGLAICPNATTLVCRYASTGIRIPNKTTGVYFVITSAKWKVVVRAWA